MKKQKHYIKAKVEVYPLSHLEGENEKGEKIPLEIENETDIEKEIIEEEIRQDREKLLKKLPELAKKLPNKERIFFKHFYEGESLKDISSKIYPPDKYSVKKARQNTYKLKERTFKDLRKMDRDLSDK